MLNSTEKMYFRIMAGHRTDARYLIDTQQGLGFDVHEAKRRIIFKG